MQHFRRRPKSEAYTEDAVLVFRSELFNAFNRAQFNNPTRGKLDVSKSASTFGQVTNSSGNPRLIQIWAEMRILGVEGAVTNTT